ncbi:MAG: hypothetical protein JNM17_37505 [Archangium sp.]|nr:hypothetical protein [Archangium sp.]
MRTFFAGAALVVCSGCIDMALVDGGTDGGRRDSGTSNNEAFEITTLDPDGGEPTWFAMAVEPTTKRIGVAYFAPRGTETNVGHPDYDLKYLEWRAGVTTAPQNVRIVQRTVGVSLAFQPGSGEPAIGMLGGMQDLMVSVFWFQHDAEVVTRSGTTWTGTIVAQNSNAVDCGNPVSNAGFLVGLWPALVYDGNGQMVFAWRDGHQNNPLGWQGSDVESAEGPLANPTIRCVMQGGNGGPDGKPAWGGRIQLVVGAGGQPAMIYDRAQGGADTTGIQLWFQRRMGTAWTAPTQLFSSNDTKTGGTLAWDSMEGYGAAVVDGASGGLRYRSSADGVTWDAEDPVYAAGSGGWYPSLAFDPQTHQPNIAYYVCSQRDGEVPTACPASFDELRVAGRTAGGWSETRVDAEGGWGPKLGFFSDGKRFVVYRDPRSGALKLATER